MIQKTKNRPIGIAVPMSQKQRTIKVHHIQVHCSTEKERLQSEDFIEEAQIKQGNFDNVGECQYAIPTYWDIGKVYKRLIKQVAEKEKIETMEISLTPEEIEEQNLNVKTTKKKNVKEKADVAIPRLNFAISSYYKGTGLEEVLKKLEEYLDKADVNESNITNI